MDQLFVAILLLSHAVALRGFWHALQNGVYPRTVDFAVASFVVYYDLGLVMQVIGFPYESAYFPSLLDREGWSFFGPWFLVLVGPWVLIAGTRLHRSYEPTPQEPETQFAEGQERKFLLVAGGIGLVLSIASLVVLAQSGSVWRARNDITSALGPLIIALYLPLHVVAFYVRQADSRRRRGLLFLGLFVVLAGLSTIVIGQRTTILLPLLIVLLFRFRITPTRLALYGLVGLIAAALMLSVFKSDFAGGRSTVGDRIVSTINVDFARADVLGRALVDSEPVGTQLMDYPGAGYVYSALFYVPRQLVPFKGDSTSVEYSASIMELEGTLDWGFAFGAMEEISLNLGIVFVLPGLLAFGYGMGLLDRLSRRAPSSVVPSRLAGLWFCGHHLPTILLLYGTMLVVVMVFDQVFRTERVAIAPANSEPHGDSESGIGAPSDHNEAVLYMFSESSAASIRRVGRRPTGTRLT